jgi:hypothetical protein
MPGPVRAFLIALLIASNLALSYGLALVGEPSSAWLWGDVLGLL